MYNKLKEMRNKRNVTDKEMANYLGISKAFYSQIENRRRRLSYEMAFKIASYFKVKPDYLFYEDTCKILNKK